MKFNSKSCEERQVVLNEKEKELLDKCSDLIEELAKDLTGMSSVALLSHDCGDFYDYTENEWYTALLEAHRLLLNLLLTDSIIGRNEEEKFKKVVDFL